MLQKQLSSEIAQQLANKRIFFTVTTGRSGTNYLANMLSYLPRVKSLHEPRPPFHDLVRDVAHNPHAATKFWVERKLPYIASIEEPIYVETSHVFCKGFFDPLLELGIVPDLILLRRDKRQVARSLYQLDMIPARTHIGELFLLRPDDPVLVPLDNWQDLHDYQLCYWYTLEIGKRQQSYGDKVRSLGGKVYDLPLEDFATIRGYWRFILEANLPKPSFINILKHMKSHIRRVNNKDDLKDRGKKTDYDELEREVLARLNH